jgi:2-keto-4-pentenoate hydratase/2-oxohepta-3-ene-1,7-dioic acid hydratase in catechol pathway
MLFKIPQLIAYISKYFRLEANDVILTGTPDGLGPIKSGDLIQGSVGNNLSKIKFTVQ